MRCLRQVIALSLVVVFLLVFPCSIWTFHSQRIMLDSRTYADAFEDEGFYRDLIPRVLPALLRDLNPAAQAPNTVTLLAAIDHLDQPTWNNLAPQLVPLSWVEYTVETNMAAVIAWLEGDAPTLEIVFRTETMRRRLEGREGQQAVHVMAAALPPCSTEQTEQFVTYVNGEGEVAFPYCRPADPATHDVLVALIDQARLDAVEQFPPDLNVVDEMRRAAAEEIEAQGGDTTHEPFSDADLDEFRAWVRLWKRLLPVTLMIPVALLSLVVIFAVRSFKTFFRWMGWALMVGCMVTLAPLFFLPFVASQTHFESEIEGGFATGGALIAEVVGNRMFEIMIGQFTWPVLIQSAILLVIGFVCVVLSVLLRDPDAPPEVYTTPSGLQAYQTPSGQVVYLDPTGSTSTAGTSATPPGSVANTPPPDQGPGPA